MDWFFLVLIFLAIALSVVAGYHLIVDVVRRDELRASRRVEELRKVGTPTQTPALYESVNEFDLGEFSRSEPSGRAATILSALRRDWLGPLRKSLARSALTVRLDQVLIASGVLALLLGGAGLWIQGPLLGVPGLVVGAIAPLVYVEGKAPARRERFLLQLSGAFELMARVIRSGQSVPLAFQAVADSFEEPIAGAFGRCREQQNMGLPPETAFQELAEQSGVLEMRIFAMAMLIQRQVGGNLSEVLERLAGLVRERRRVRLHIRTLTAEGRLQATVLLVLPFFIFLVMRFVNREYADELLHHVGLLVATAAAMGIGALWIHRIINFDV